MLMLEHDQCMWTKLCPKNRMILSRGALCAVARQFSFIGTNRTQTLTEIWFARVGLEELSWPAESSQPIFTIPNPQQHSNIFVESLFRRVEADTAVCGLTLY